MQAVSPLVAPNVPLRHGVQVLAPVDEKEPSKHTAQSVDPMLDALLPAAQLVHVEDPWRENVPLSQMVHVLGLVSVFPL